MIPFIVPLLGNCRFVLPKISSRISADEHREGKKARPDVRSNVAVRERHQAPIESGSASEAVACE
jgi:hypothetical protein